MATHKLAILVTAIGAAKAAKDLRGVDAAVSGIGGHAGRGIRTGASNIGRLGVVAGTVAVTGLAAAAKAAIDWEDAFQGVVKTVDAADLAKAGMSFDDLSNTLREMSRDMPNTAIELAGIAEAAGAMGIKAPDIAAFTKQVAILASTTNVSAEDAATALGQMGTIIGLTGDEFDNFAAALVDLGNKGSSTEAQILEIARRSGGAAKLMHIAKDATLGWAAAAANLGLNEELAGTALQTFFVKTRVAIANNGPALEKIASTAGMTAKQFKKAFKDDASGALETFIKGLSKLSEGDRIKTIQSLFGKTSGLTRLLLGLSQNTDNLTDSVNTSTKAWEDATAAQVEFDKRNQTVKSAFARLKNNVIDSMVLLGEGFAPALGRAADKLSDFLKVPENRTAIKKLGEDIGKLLDGIDWPTLIQNVKGLMAGFQSASGVAKGLWDGFNAMPADLKGLLIALVGVNKLTGGAVSGIVGELGKGLVKGVLGMNAGVVNIKAGVVNGAGGAGVPGAGGGSSKLMKGIAAASIVGDVAAVIATQQEQSSQNTAFAAEIKQGLDDSIATKSLGQLQVALLGVQQGITDISSNPLYALVQGDALTSLKQMETDLKTAISQKSGAEQRTETKRETTKGAAFGTTGKDKKPLTDIKTSTDSVKSQTAASGKELRSGQKETARETAKGAAFMSSTTRSSVYAGAAMTVSAIRSIPAPITNVSVVVGAGTITKEVTHNNRGGKSGGSRDWTDYGKGGGG